MSDRRYDEEEVSKLSEAMKEKFRKALDGKLKTPVCRDCVGSRGFVQVMEFVIDMMTDATERMDVASQRMEDFIEVFNQLEEREMKARMTGVDGR